MASLNKVILIGNLGKDPEMRYMPSGGAVAGISIATTENWKDKQTGEAKSTTEWHSVTFFNRLAEIAGEYLKKGSKIYLEGRLKTEKWKDKQGNDRYTTKIIGSSLLMLDTKNKPQGQQQYGNDFQQQNNQPPAQQNNQQQNYQQNPPQNSAPPPQNQAQGAYNTNTGQPIDPAQRPAQNNQAPAQNQQQGQQQDNFRYGGQPAGGPDDIEPPF